MRWKSVVFAIVAACCLLAPSPGHADLNEVGALLVFPVVIGVEDQETFITVTNAAPYPVTAHVSFINGDEEDPDYCYECDFLVELTANDTETLVVTSAVGSGLSIESEDGEASIGCDAPFGMIIVNVEHVVDGGTDVGTDNILFGEQVVVDYANGYAYSISAISVQGGNGDGNREFDMDGTEYDRLPRYLAADFIAPGDGPITADLALFTLNFIRQEPPHTDCSVIGFDADEHPFSDSMQFGCWTVAGLESINPEFAYPNLGQLYGQFDTHGWLSLNCSSIPQVNGQLAGPLAHGTVHGALVQHAGAGAVLRRDTDEPRPNGPALSDPAAWARTLYQSRTQGDEAELKLEDNGACFYDLDGDGVVDCDDVCMGGEFTVIVSFPFFGDETTWTMTGGSGATVASAGTFAFGSTNVSTFSTTDTPLTFRLETQGTFNDNSGTYSIECDMGTIVEGSFLGGQVVTESDLCCGSNRLPVNQASSAPAGGEGLRVIPEP